LHHVTASSRLPSHPSRFGAVVAQLTSVNILLVFLALVTSPILARTLGPSGRGEVAAIFAVVGIAPWISELGMTAFLSREHARRARPLGVLLGSTMPITLAASLVGVALAVPIARAIGHGREEVTSFIELGLLLLPVSVFAQTLFGVAVGDQRWRVIMLARIIAGGGSACAIVILSLSNTLTVSTAAATYIVIGLLANAPFLIGLRGSRPWRFVTPVARQGLAFGVRSWLSTIATTGNAQLDQVLIAGLASSRQLGLYSLAVTLSMASSSLVGATMSALVPRVAAGESELAARACRVTLLLAIALGVAIAATSPLVVPFVFGRAFTAMIPMLLILLAASFFYVPGQVLGAALIAGGNPSGTARGQLVGLALTVPLLIVVVPFAGGIGAACVSFAAYAVTFAIIVRAAAATFRLSHRTLLIPTLPDFRWLWQRIRRRPAIVT
jgi:O-antigen/teichoic acid export membrane protein